MRAAHAILLLSLALSACASAPGLSCHSPERLAVRDTLFFGAGKPQGVVSPEEWTRFLETAVTPKFGQGLTVSQATGQWRGADGAIVRESTWVLELIHPDDAPNAQWVAEITAAYKAEFQQEAVLRARAAVCVSF